MTIQCINPADLPVPEIYSQVVVATGSRMAFVSGQQPEDIHGKLVGEGDFAAQISLFGNHKPTNVIVGIAMMSVRGTEPCSTPATTAFWAC